MFASPDSQNRGMAPRFGTPTSNSRPTPSSTNPLINSPFQNQRSLSRATTPPPSAGRLVRRVATPSSANRNNNNNNQQQQTPSQHQHHRPSQISFTDFGNDDQNVPGKTGDMIGRKHRSHEEENEDSSSHQAKNQAYMGYYYPPDQQQQQQQQYEGGDYDHNQHNHPHSQSPDASSYYQQNQNDEQQQLQNQEQEYEAGSPEYLQQYYQEDRKLQKCFQSDIKAAQPLFSARQIATRHLNSGFQLFAGNKGEFFTDRLLQMPPSTNRTPSTATSFRGLSPSTTRNASVLTSVPEQTASPCVIDYHDDVGHGKRTLRAMRLERKQQGKDDARAFVERNGISILGRMQDEQAAGSSTDALPGLMNRKNRGASPSSSHTHLKGVGQVEDCNADGSRFRFSRKVHPEQLHQSNLTRALLPVRKIKTPSANALASPPRAPHAARVGVKHSVDTNRVLCPDMIPESRTPRLRSLRPPEMLGQGMEIKEGAPQWTWKGGLRGDFWREAAPTDPFRGADGENDHGGQE